MARLVSPAPGPPATPHSARCETVRLPVSLAPGEAAAAHVVGRLCAKDTRPAHTLQVLLSGATYDQRYWDFPLQPAHYSYVRALTEAGYATFTLDRIGVGASDRPPAHLVTVEADAFVVHQVVQELRQGFALRPPFGRIILVGHSLGAAVALVEASRYGDVDGLILSGFLHTFGPGAGELPAMLHPADLDPAFRDRPVPAGYLTTRPGTRASLFYAPAHADADVIAADEAAKDAAAATEFADVPGVVGDRALPRALRMPVLVVVGQEDTTFCSPPACPEARDEADLYPSEARPQVVVLPAMGHALNLHRAAPDWFALASAWTDRHFGPYGQSESRGAPATSEAPNG